MLILGPEKSSANLGFPDCINCWQKPPSLYLSQGMAFIYSSSLCKNPSWPPCQVCHHLCRLGIENNMKLQFPESVLPKKLTDRGVLHSLCNVGALHWARWTLWGSQKQEPCGCWELLKGEISNFLTLVGRNSKGDHVGYLLYLPYSAGISCQDFVLRGIGSDLPRDQLEADGFD